MYKTIVFDLDGTLLDTLDDLTDATNHALSVFGLKTRTRDEVCSFVGNGIAKLVERAIGEKNYPDFAKIFSEFKVYYGAHCADKTQPYAGMIELLNELKRRGVKTAVVSNKADFAVKSLARTYFSGLLCEAVGENEDAGIRKKPAPDSLFAVMEALQADKQTTVYVGDSEVDVQTAKNAGLDCICVTWGFRDKDFLRETGAEIFVDEPSEILLFTE